MSVYPELKTSNMNLTEKEVLYPPVDEKDAPPPYTPKNDVVLCANCSKKIVVEEQKKVGGFWTLFGRCL
jgi:hypothetical protein